jgi:hypothetical protein
VIEDRLSKYAHFMAISHPYMAVSAAQVLLENIFKLHGMPKLIVCDRDLAFTSQLQTELFCLHGTLALISVVPITCKWMDKLKS